MMKNLASLSLASRLRRGAVKGEDEGRVQGGELGQSQSLLKALHPHGHHLKKATATCAIPGSQLVTAHLLAHGPAYLSLLSAISSIHKSYLQ